MTPVIPTTTGNPTPPSPSGSTGIPLLVIVIAIIVCVTVAVIPIVIIGLRAVVHRIHNRWVVKEIHQHPEIADTIGRLRACGADDGLLMEENGE